jgi:hypothetical protein
MMFIRILLFLGMFALCLGTHAQQQELTPSQELEAQSISDYLKQRDGDITSKIDFPTFLKLAQEVYEYRKTRLLKLDDFLARAKNPNTIILDSRSTKMYALKHVKGAVHLDFSDYTQETLFRLIPDRKTTILIYCNNNFLDDQQAFPSKMAVQPVNLGGEKINPTLALNIPTFINLYGYGYRNVYELADLVSVDDPRLQFAGSGVK